MWVPFCFVCLYLVMIWGGFFCHYGGAFGYIFSMWGAYLPRFSLFWELFLPCGFFLLLFSILRTFLGIIKSLFAVFSLCGALSATFLSFLGTFFNMWGPFSHFFLRLGGLFWACPFPPQQKFLFNHCHPTSSNYASNNGITIEWHGYKLFVFSCEIDI